jgi:hypothetical protein
MTNDLFFLTPLSKGGMGGFSFYKGGNFGNGVI